MVTLPHPLIFDWDSGNRDKNLIKHSVNDAECESVFISAEKVISKDTDHSTTEQRHIVLGRTSEGRLLYIVFTIRGEKIRVISARDIGKNKERKLYEKTTHST